MSTNQQTKDNGVAQQDKDKDKFDYLKAKYVFRYPFTFTSIKWALALGSFLALHTYTKSRNIKKSFQYMIWGSFFMTFPIWAFFMTKYSFYQSSIQGYEEQEMGKIRSIEMYKHYVQFKLKLPKEHDLSQQQLMNKYEDFLRDNFDRNCQLDCLLEKVNAKTYDIVV